MMEISEATAEDVPMRKEAYLRIAEARLENMIRQIDDLSNKADMLEDDERILYAEQVELLRWQERGLRRWIDTLAQSREADWEHLRTGFDRGMSDLQKAVEKTVLMLRDIA
jgi:hypothetical protein